MEKPHREKFDELLSRQEDERNALIGETHGEALAVDEQITAHKDATAELKGEGTKEGVDGTNNKFLTDTYITWYSVADAAEAKQEAILIRPGTQDYEALSESTEPTEFGRYTLNPETQGLDFEKHKAFVPDLSAWNDKPLHEVVRYVMDTYGDRYYVPGIEYWKWLYENPGKNPPGVDLKDGKWYFLPGSVLRNRDGRWSVPCADWSRSELHRGEDWLTSGWSSYYRVVLLEK